MAVNYSADVKQLFDFFNQNRFGIDRAARLKSAERHRNTDPDMYLIYLAGYGFADEVDKLLANGANVNLAVLGYIVGSKFDELNKLLERGENCNKAIYHFAAAGYVEQVNLLLKTFDDKGLRLSDSNKKAEARFNALKGYVDGRHFKAAFLLKNELQQEKRNFKTFLVILFAIILTPLSLIVSIPLWIRAKRDEPIQQVTTSVSDYEEVKRRRKLMRGDEPKMHDENKPKKVLIADDGKERVYLMDREQAARYRLFTKTKLADLEAKKASIKSEVVVSKGKSVSLVRNMHG